MIDESKVMVAGGVWCEAWDQGVKGTWVSLRETTNGVLIHHKYEVIAALTPDQARTMARQLLRLAQRVDNRGGQ